MAKCAGLRSLFLRDAWVQSLAFLFYKKRKAMAPQKKKGFDARIIHISLARCYRTFLFKERGKARTDPSPCIKFIESVGMKKGTEIKSLRYLIVGLEKAGKRNNALIWKRVAFMLSKPSRKRVEVNLNRLESVGNAGEVLLVPGKVLGIGNVTKKFKVAALRFSKSALIKMQKAGIEAVPIAKLVQDNPKGSKVRLIA